ncbi:retron St85 family RNA-directed DNA polymerase [Erwinia persicina]|uniref:retron St85 family RNA-directed DNA polymerase n=1 Tax=Erwinia persicina TaxID=55211 RepID=UPI00210290D5|nr:retron St85 family RNA-directed DNA polymerase [Erwinia persicina]MCQ4106513.1 retron St85 family RNA-directed DNA polymerase [Erwinia persicina]UTX14760.1 retron St85 family RNA-directed DNA polymerase [Erwinia persicina]
MLFSDRICNELGYSKRQLSAFLKNAPRKYRVYTIPKRTIGYRTIAHPSKDLKKIQRICDSMLRDLLPVHTYAFAYKKGASIKSNALHHVNQPYLLKLDFSNYFNSITPEIFWNKIDRLSIPIHKKERNMLQKIIFWQPNRYDNGKLKLSIGAPTSPLISNFVAYEFDDKILNYCQSQGIVYSRYADDLTFSTFNKDILFSLPRITKAYLNKYFDGITINEMKTKFSSKKHNRHVTGITLTDEGAISLGREEKRRVFHFVHKFSLGELEPELLIKLRGQISFFEHIQPGFTQRLINKYTEHTINTLLYGD